MILLLYQYTDEVSQNSHHDVMLKARKKKVGQANK